MYIKKKVKEEIYAMYLSGIPIEEIAGNKEIKVMDAERAYCRMGGCDNKGNKSV